MKLKQTHSRRWIQCLAPMSMWCFNQQLTYKICYSLLFLCTVIKNKMYKPRLLLQFGIHRWSYGRVGEQELECSKVFIIRHFKSHGGLLSTCNGRKKEQGAWGSLGHMSCSFQVLLPLRTSCMQLWLQFVTKENAMFCGYHRWFSKYKSSFGSQTGNNSFCQRDKRKTH